jgi:hypothetical protein
MKKLKLKNIFKNKNFIKDIQPIGSYFGIAYYVAKYVAKEENQILRSDIKKAIQAVQEVNKENLTHAIHNATRILMSHRERSAQEAAYILCGLRLRGASRDTIFINTKPKLARTRMLKRESFNNENYEDDDFCSDIFEKYEKRPIELEEICLAEFATKWRILPKNATKQEKLNQDDQDNDALLNENENNLDEDSENKCNNTEFGKNKIFYLIGSTIPIKLRKNEAILKTPMFSLNDDKEQYYYSLLVLYLPFRKEERLVKTNESIEETFLSKFNCKY